MAAAMFDNWFRSQRYAPVKIRYVVVSADLLREKYSPYHDYENKANLLGVYTPPNSWVHFCWQDT
jgi:hypothetical protein